MRRNNYTVVGPSGQSQIISLGDAGRGGRGPSTLIGPSGPLRTSQSLFGETPNMQVQAPEAPHKA
eukprot:10006496-Alexandrium_andersonii.AAC.1